MARPSSLQPRFTVGSPVAIANRPAVGHCRTPHYLRGRAGVVVAVQGAHPDAERLAYHKPGLPLEYIYKIRFRQTHLWPHYRGNPSDHLEADITESWLDPRTRRRPAHDALRARPRRGRRPSSS
ncbi:MAG: nitrile hydratase subunit beta [Hyphomicrobiaceae bacterium]